MPGLSGLAIRYLNLYGKYRDHIISKWSGILSIIGFAAIFLAPTLPSIKFGLDRRLEETTTKSRNLFYRPSADICPFISSTNIQALQPEFVMVGSPLCLVAGSSIPWISPSDEQSWPFSCSMGLHHPMHHLCLPQ